jgi:spermidine synthase
MSEKDKNQQIGLAELDPKKDQALNLWFHDSMEMAHGCGMSIRIKDVLCQYRSEFQEITILETEKLGRMLVLDDITMLTEYDEFAYHEMIVHVPLLVHPKPSRILVIGGGDGGAVREILKHPEVEQVHVCEIDEEVIKVCREFLPSLASCFDDRRVKVLHEDGAHFVTRHPHSYEVVIVDSTDPVGPGQILFQRQFYEDMKGALSEDGIAVTQCESMYLHQDVIKGVASFAREVYPKVGYYYTMVPSYPSGVIGFFFCSLKYDPLTAPSQERATQLRDLKYYTPDLHRAAFTLPRFAADLFRTE